MRIRRRWVLLVLLNAAQLACLLVGLGSFSRWLEIRLSDTLADQVFQNNRHVAGQIADLVGDLKIQSLEHGTEGWSRLQALVERTQLPNEGFICVVSRETTKLVCHPDMRHRPELATKPMGSKTLLAADAGAAAAIVASGDSSASGWVEMPDGIHLVGVRHMPELGISVLAHQRQRGVDAAVASVIGPVRRGGVVATLAIVLVTVISSMIIVRCYENRLARINAGLEEAVESRSRSLMVTRDAVIFGLAKLAESRDNETGEHLERIHAYVSLLAHDLAKRGAGLDVETARLVATTSSLHDIGKVGIPDAVLLKPGKLTEDEFAQMKEHTIVGGSCLEAIKNRLGEDDFLNSAYEIALWHHERWDGTGYPFGLSGEEIPLSARIVAVADVYDALTSRRVYKNAMSHREARAFIVGGRGTQFDPRVVDSFIRLESKFIGIATSATRRHAAHAA